jgi:cystathionine beta-synthase
MKIGDHDSFECARRLIKEEGFLCGGSSGTALAGALKYIKDNNIGEGKRCVFLCPDNIRNYITKFINNDWMYEHGFISEEDCANFNIPKLVPHNVWGKDFTIKDLKLTPAVFLPDNMTCKEAIDKIKEQSYDQYPVQDRKEMRVVGVITSQLLMSKLVNQKVNGSDPISKVMTKDFRNMSSGMSLSELGRVLDRQNFVLVDGSSIVSSYDLLNFM